MLFLAMMKKADKETAHNAGLTKYEPLLSQNMSVIEVGAYSHIFATFLGFLGIKTLIITDLDCAKSGSNEG
jgi:putative ATP-dependent endonuclease of OLD family